MLLEKIKRDLECEFDIVSAIDPDKEISKSMFHQLLKLHERLYLSIRKIPTYYDAANMEDELQSARGIVKISENDNIYTFVFPNVLPARRQDNSTFRTLYNLYKPDIAEYFKNRNYARFQDAVVWFEDVYVNPANAVDYDNKERKYIMDLVSRALLLDDSPSYCSKYESMRKGERDCMCVYVMERVRFPGVMKMHEKSGKV